MLMVGKMILLAQELNLELELKKDWSAKLICDKESIIQKSAKVILPLHWLRQTIQLASRFDVVLQTAFTTLANFNFLLLTALLVTA